MEAKVLGFGDHGADVAEWQSFLNHDGCVDGHGERLQVDGDFGSRTQQATKSYQVKAALAPSGFLDLSTRAHAYANGYGREVDGLSFIQARNYTRNPKNFREIDFLVLHCTQGREAPKSARGTAMYFANQQAPGTRLPNGTRAPASSAHLVVGDYEVIRCVRDCDYAWHAGDPANSRSIGVEIVGMAEQTAEQWADEYSMRVLANAASVFAALCKRYSIPVVLLEPEALKVGDRGLSDHARCSKAWGGTHWDPGPNFPWTAFLAMIRTQFGVASSYPPPAG